MAGSVGGAERSMLRKQADFCNPGPAFRPAAYWFWHSIPDAATALAQLADFQAQGFGTIYIQARLSFPRAQYLSPAFIRAYRDAVEAGGKMGLKLGIYDDYNWISGHAGGRTVEGREDLRERHLFFATFDGSEGGISGIRPSFMEGMGPDIMAWQYEGGQPRWDDWEVVAALMHPADMAGGADSTLDITSEISITHADPLSCSLAHTLPPEPGQRVTVFVSARCATSRMINYLMPEAAERFIEVGIAPLVDALEGLIPALLDSLFYDQPSAGFYRWDQMKGNLGNSLLYAAGLAEVAERETGSTLPLLLLALVQEVGPATARLRAGFYRAYSGLMNRAFFGTLRGYAEARGLKLTGHEMLPHIAGFALNGGFTAIDPRVAPAVDFFGIDAFRHETAADANNFHAQLSPKLGDSVARAHGRSRCVVETYATAERTERRGAGQWELTLETMRAQAIRLYCLGARQFLWHGLYQTDGDSGNAELFVNPRFDFAPGLNFEPWWPYHRLFAEETARISAFLEPAEPRLPVALLYPLATAYAEGPRHGHARHFGGWCESLLECGVDFSIVSEDDLAGGTLEGPTLRTRSGQCFHAVVLGNISVLENAATNAVLRTFKAGGGTVWVSGARFATEISGPSDEPVELPATAWLEHAPTPADLAPLAATLPREGPELVQTQGGKLWRWTGREADGSWRMVIFNGAAEPARCSIRLGSGFELEQWMPESGVVETLGLFTSLEMVLEPQAVRLFRMTAGEASRAVAVETSALAFDAELMLSDGWQFQPGPHAPQTAVSPERGWEQQGFAAFSGTGHYRLTLEIPRTGEWQLLLPGVATAAEVFLDDVSRGRRAWSPYRFDLGPLQAGVHTLEIAVSNTAANHYYAGTPYLGNTLDRSGLTAPPRLILLSACHSRP